MLRLKSFLILTIAVFLLMPQIALQVANATSITIADEYWGADDHGYGDVIGDEAIFGIDSMTVQLVGNLLYVDIQTNFAGRGDDGFFSSYTVDSKGIGYGDLFLNSSWNPNGTAGGHYVLDNSSTGTQFAYAFSLDNRWMTNGQGTGTLYSLSAGTYQSNVLLSDDFMSGATYRNRQEVAVDTASGDVKGLSGNSSWSVDDSEIHFIIDLVGTNLLSSDEIALHWGMTCANEVIEGSAPVPEPATILLSGIGLLGMGFFLRRKTRATV